MSRLLLLLLVAGAALAVVSMVVALSSKSAAGAERAHPRLNAIQKVAYAVLIAAMFGVASGALGEG
ncbi:hypothetical protein [Primorskyibacter sp. S187A]|uniref:hypothetical protein n=1 Tax=Primorskyibacter sp. S187A TaxID=3415130 RepID=UPI003C7BBE03